MNPERFIGVVLSHLGPFVLVLGVLIFVHELGHFLTAKALGVRVLRFSLGLGPRLVGVKVGGTDYRISALPLGGYVKMAGDETGEATGARGEFLSAPWWHRALIGFAGPGSNLLFAFLFSWIVVMVGIPVPDYPPLVHRASTGSVADSLDLAAGDRITAVGDSAVATWQGFLHLLLDRDGVGTPWPRTVLFEGPRGVRRVSVDEPTALRLAEAIQPAHPSVVGNVLVNLPAYRAGVQQGDSIVAVAGKPVRTFEEVATIVHASINKPLALDLVRRGRPVRVTVKPISPEAAGGPRMGMIGIEPVGSDMRYVRGEAPGKAAVNAARGLVMLTGQMVTGLVQTVRHFREARDVLTGPIGIAQMAASYSRQGIEILLSFTAIIGITLALMNLLPIPVLDGGHIAFALYEGIARRPLSLKAQLAFQRVGLALIGSLLVFVLVNDTVHYVEHQRAVRADDRRAPPLEAPAP